MQDQDRNDEGAVRASDVSAMIQRGPAFCWSKYAAESGESSGGILARKEAERAANGGMFLWGIGSSIRPSLVRLLEMSANPMVVFSAMKSQAAAHDARPEHVAFWDSGIGIRGETYRVPESSVVTSRASARGRRKHFALVCSRPEPIRESGGHAIRAGQLRNLTSGSAIGHSQVTSVVVESAELPPIGPQYDLGFTATLVAPYLVTLDTSVSLPFDEVREAVTGGFWELLDLRRSLFSEPTQATAAAALGDW